MGVTRALVEFSLKRKFLFYFPNFRPVTSGIREKFSLLVCFSYKIIVQTIWFIGGKFPALQFFTFRIILDLAKKKYDINIFSSCLHILTSETLNSIRSVESKMSLDFLYLT